MPGEWDVAQEIQIAPNQVLMPRASEWDVAQEIPLARKRQVGVAEAGARGVGSGFAGQGNVLGLAAAAPAVIGDWLANLFRDNPEYPASEAVFPLTADVTKNAVDYYAPKPDEQMGGGATAANIGGNLAAMLPAMIASGGTAGSAATIAGNLTRGAVAAQPSFAIPATVNRAQQLLESGVDEGTTLKASISNQVMNTLLGALPVSKAGGLVARSTTGAAINAGTGAAQRGIEGEILGDENKAVALPAFGGKEMGTDAGIGALMAAILGPRARAPVSQARPGADSGADAAMRQQAADFEQYRPILEANGITDPASDQAAAAITALKARDARRADEQASSQERQQAPTPPEQIPGQRPTGTIQVDSQGRAEPASAVVTPRGRVVSAPTPEKAAVAAARAVDPSGTPLADAEISLITERSGIPDAEVRQLSVASQRKLFDTYREQDLTQDARAAAGDFRTTDAGLNRPGEEAYSPASRPVVPGDRTAARGEYEDRSARAQPMPDEVAAMKPTPAAARAEVKRKAMIEELDATRKQRETMLQSEGYRAMKRSADAGEAMTDKQQKTWAAAQKQVGRMTDRIFKLEGDIYAIEGTSELGSRGTSGIGDRPFRATDSSSGLGDNERFYQEQAQAKADADLKASIDRLEAEWRARQDAKREREAQRKTGERQEQAPDRGEARYAGKRGTKNAAPLEGGFFPVDDYGYVRSDNGNPVHFVHQRDAGWWILKRGNKEAQGQVFEIANHPSGEGFTVRETQRQGPRPESKGDLVPQQPKKPGGSAGEPQPAPAKPAPKAEAQEPQIPPSERSNSPEYESVNARTSAATAEFRKAQEAYRNRSIGDAEFLQAKAKHDAAQREFDIARGEQPPVDAAPETPAKPAPKPAKKKPSQARAGSGILMMLRKYTGTGGRQGIASNLARDIAGEPAMILNRRLPGLFRKNGLAGDDLVEALQQNGYLTQAEIDAANESRPGGSVDLAYDIIRRSMENEQVRQVGDERGFQSEAAAHAEQAMYDHAESLGIDTKGKAQDEIAQAIGDHVLREELRGDNATAEDQANVDLAARAAEINPDAFERATMEHADDDAAFMQAVKEIINGDERTANQASGDETRQGAAEVRPDEIPAERAGDNAGQQPAADEVADILKPYDAAELRSREQRIAEAEQRRLAEEKAAEDKRKADSQRDDFSLTGSDRAADSNPNQGTLYGGFPLDKMAAAVADAFKWATGDAESWSKSLRSFSKDLNAARESINTRTEGNPVVSFIRAAFDSASGDIRSILRKHPSKTAQEVVDKFHVEAGTDRVTSEIYQDAVRSRVNKRLGSLDNLIGKFDTDESAMKQIANLVRNPAGIKRGTTIGDAALGIRKMLDEELKYMRDAGVDIGEVRDGYYPREINLTELMKNPQGFIDAAAQAYRELGMPTDEAMASAKGLHDTMIYGETSSLIKGSYGNPKAPFINGRVFGKGVDKPNHPLNKFLVSDPMVTLPKYFERAARRAEIARRFGDQFSHWDDWKDANGDAQKGFATKIREEGGAHMVEHLRDYVALAAGLRKQGVGNMAIRASSFLRTWASFAFLEKATLSSLTEFIVPAVRSGNIMDAGRSLHRTFSDLFTRKISTTATERRAMAEDLGLIAGHITDTINAARFAGGQPISQLEAKAMDKFFKRTGLTQWTDATRVASMDVGRVFIRRLAKDYADGGKLTQRYLAELGVPTDKAKAFTDFVLAANDGMPTVGSLKGPMADTYRQAVRRFVTQSIMDPHATLKPKWMNHPIGAVVGQLQSFNYAFWENVLKRNGRLLKEAATGSDYKWNERAQMVMPTLILPMMWAAAYAIGEVRDAAFADPERRKKETVADKAIKAASRGVPIAPIDPLVNYITNARYQRSSIDFAAGPALGTLGKTFDIARNLMTQNSENTNTAERAAAKAAWDVFVEPTVNLMLSGTPVAPFSAAVTQAVGSGHLREKAVTAVAGPQKKKGGFSMP